MKIGDKVRFLSDVGGGRISGFRSGGIVLVEDEDGFEIPTPQNEVVVVNDDNFTPKPTTVVQKGNAPKPTTPPTPTAAPELKPEERQGGDKLSVYMAFVPKDYRNMQDTRFMTYMVNDSNYFIRYTYMTAEGNAWTLRAEGAVAPNTKVRIDEFGREQLNQLQHGAVQLLAYKRDKPFLMKPMVEVQMRLDAVKFYKLNTFRENDFFETPALLQTIVENDIPQRPLVVDAQLLKQQLYEPAEQEAARIASMKPDKQTWHADSKRPVGQKLKDDKIVVDLHASELLDTTAGMNAGDILEYQLDVFRKTLEQYKDRKGLKLIFIHGKGEGVLRKALIHELKYRYKQYAYQDASFREYGYGATQVTIR